MKTIIHSINLLLCSSIILFSLVNCEDKKAPFEERDVAFSEYSLNGSYQWINLKYGSKEVIVIRNKSELENYITPVDKEIPDIDFSAYSLLLASGGETYGITTISKQLKEIAPDEYNFDIDITLNLTAEAPRWVVAILAPAIPRNANILLNVTRHH
jgi:hypothetical protein